MKTYKEIITDAMTDYANKYPKTKFIGYNVSHGSKMYGTLEGITNPTQLLETPVAENLMAGLAVGLALEGYRPVLCFERHDFILLALDAIVNHIDKLPKISNNTFKLPILIRAIVGGKKPLYPGLQHTQNYTKALRSMLKYTPVVSTCEGWRYKMALKDVGKTKSGAVVLVEHRDKYSNRTF